MATKKQKSLLFILIVLAASGVALYVFFQAYFNTPEEAANFNLNKSVRLIESASVTNYDTEFDQALKAFDEDTADLNKLQNDPVLNALDSDGGL